MQNFTLGIIGRCLSCQPWMPPSELYHKKINLLLQQSDQITLRVSIASRSDLEPYERLLLLHKKKKLNGVLYHVKALSCEGPLLLPTSDALGKRRYFLNPVLSNYIRNKGRFIYEGSYAVDGALAARHKPFSECPFHLPRQAAPSLPKRKCLGIPLGTLNLLAGKLCGIPHLFLASELFFLTRLQSLCLQLQLPLFVLGPTPSLSILEKKESMRIWQRYCNRLQNTLLQRGIPHYFFDFSPEGIFTNDGAHISLKGHTELAHGLYPLLSPWIRSILNAEKPHYGGALEHNLAF